MEFSLRRLLSVCLFLSLSLRESGSRRYRGIFRVITHAGEGGRGLRRTSESYLQEIYSRRHTTREGSAPRKDEGAQETPFGATATAIRSEEENIAAGDRYKIPPRVTRCSPPEETRILLRLRRPTTMGGGDCFRGSLTRAAARDQEEPSSPFNEQTARVSHAGANASIATTMPISRRRNQTLDKITNIGRYPARDVAVKMSSRTFVTRDIFN